jgi:coenzyme PQQ precursor peptide PqqA
MGQGRQGNRDGQGLETTRYPACLGMEPSLPLRQRTGRFCIGFVNDSQRTSVMAWTTPTLVEICVGLEINGYLPAEF